MKRGKQSGWFFTHEGVEFGPMSDAELCNAADTGLILPTDEVRSSQIDTPVSAAEIEGLFASQQETDSEPIEEEPSAGSVYQPDIVGAGSVTCIHCWYKFEPEEVLFIARHPDLVGDPILGTGDQQRFLPSRFTPEGHAIDSEGVVCPDIACPRCHLQLPRSVLDMKPLFVSLVGATESGKSYFLASMSWQLRTTLPRNFLVSFADTDGMANSWLTDYEERLFMQADQDTLQMIGKTDVREDSLFRQISLGGMPMSLPMPSVFSLCAEKSSLFHSEAKHCVNRCLVLYDAAGEHFQPGRDSASDPGTQHLVHAESLLLMFDPTRSIGFRRALIGAEDPQLKLIKSVQRQDVIFTEALNRIRLYLGLGGQEKLSRPVVVLLSKADVLGPEIDAILNQTPWRWNEEWKTSCLDVSLIMRVSYSTRSLIQKYAPEVVTAVESAASDVVYMPVSALGCSPVLDHGRQGGTSKASLVVRTGDIRPKWAEVPILYTLFKLGCIGGICHKWDDHPEPKEFEVRGGMLHFVIPGTSRRLSLPTSYASFSLQDHDTGNWFRVPEVKNAQVRSGV